jgi:hypothetical protein
VDRRDQSCFFLASLRLLFPRRGYSDEEYRTRHHALIMRKFRWHKFGTPGVWVGLRKVRLFIQAQIYFLQMCAVTHIILNYTPSILVISMPKETSASRRFVWCTASHVTMCLSAAGMLCCTALVASLAITFLDPCLVKPSAVAADSKAVGAGA